MAGAAETMEITMPRRKEFISAAKMAACALSAQLDFPCDRMRDIALAVEEACILLAGHRASTYCQELILRFGVEPGKVTVEVGPHRAALADSGGPLAFDDPDGELSLAVLRGVMDEVRVSCDASEGACVIMAKYRTNP